MPHLLESFKFKTHSAADIDEEFGWIPSEGWKLYALYRTSNQIDNARAPLERLGRLPDGVLTLVLSSNSEIVCILSVVENASMNRRSATVCIPRRGIL